MSINKLTIMTILLILASWLTACGQKGALYLPDTQNEGTQQTQKTNN